MIRFRRQRNQISRFALRPLSTRLLKTGSIHKTVSELLESEMGATGVDFGDIADYALLLVYLMAKLDFTKTECRQFLLGFENLIEKYRSIVPYDIYSQFLKTQTRPKLNAARNFIGKL